jgi:hypothetical protein
VKVFVAGAGNYKDALRMIGLFGGLDCFSSYFDVREVETFILLRKHRPRSVVCDSGAHAYFSASGVQSASPVKLAARLDSPKDYVEGYAKLIHEALPFVEKFVEFDTVEIHGTTFQKWQRKRLLEAVRDPARLIPVYRASEPRSALHKLMDEFTTIGLEGYRNKNFLIPDYLDITRKCYERGIKVHVFASVDRKFLMSCPIYSTDSSSWSMVYRAGVFNRFTGKGMSNLHRSNIRRRFDIAVGVAEPLSKAQVKSETVFRYRDLIRTSLEQYEKFAQYLTEVWKARGIVWQ